MVEAMASTAFEAFSIKVEAGEGLPSGSFDVGPWFRPESCVRRGGADRAFRLAVIMNALQSIEAIVLVGILALVVFLLRKIATLTRSEVDLAPVLVGFDSLHRSQEQIERSVRDEMVRNRQESASQNQSLRAEVLSSMTTVGESLASNIQNQTRSTDQRLDLIRNGVEQRLEAFSGDSGRRIEQLSQSVSDATARLQGEVAGQLKEYRTSLNQTVRETHDLHREHSQAMSAAFQSFQFILDEKQLGFHTMVDAKLSTIGHDTTEKLRDVEATLHHNARQLRDETGTALKGFGDSVLKTLSEMTQLQKGELQDLRSTVDARLATIQTENERKLEQMRQTVDERLQGTLEARLGESFKIVSDNLEQVSKGLGEMRSLATGVGDLKRVLTNVKTRGTWGEVQLGALLDQMLAPDQYSQNVATSGTGERVEFAIKLPGRDTDGLPVWLPIDAKFPVEDYQRLIDASERADIDAVDRASRQLEATLKACARSLSEKYIAPPLTTDFGILFLASEGLYAEAIRRPGLAEWIQREHRIVIAGPSTLAALLNSLQMGFRTLAIQQRSSEVWELLGAVKTEFTKYADVLAKVKKKLTEARNTIDTAEVRTRAIRRSLRNVEASDGIRLLDGPEQPKEEITEDSLSVADPADEDRLLLQEAAD